MGLQLQVTINPLDTFYPFLNDICAFIGRLLEQEAIETDPLALSGVFWSCSSKDCSDSFFQIGRVKTHLTGSIM